MPSLLLVSDFIFSSSPFINIKGVYLEAITALHTTNADQKEFEGMINFERLMYLSLSLSLFLIVLSLIRAAGSLLSEFLAHQSMPYTDDDLTGAQPSPEGGGKKKDASRRDRIPTLQKYMAQTYALSPKALQEAAKLPQVPFSPTPSTLSFNPKLKQGGEPTGAPRRRVTHLPHLGPKGSDRMR